MRVLTKARLAAEIMAAYVFVRWWMLRGGLVETVAACRSRAPGVPRERSDQEAVAAGRRLGRAVMRTLEVLPTDARCLVRSLVLTRLLARRGIDSTLRIGVRPGPDFAAHAWVEHAGLALLPAIEGTFEPLTEL